MHFSIFWIFWFFKPSLHAISFIHIYWSSPEKFRWTILTNNAKLLFLALSGVFFIFLFRSFFYENFINSIVSLSPMLPLPLISLLILLQRETQLRISSWHLATYSQFAIFFATSIYILSVFLGPEYYIANDASDAFGRLELLSGNPIPFSFGIFGVAIFCLSDWKNANFTRKILGIVCFFLGIYFGGFLSGTRTTFITIFIFIPFLLWVFFKPNYIAVAVVLLTAICSITILYKFLNNVFVDNISSKILVYGSEILNSQIKGESFLIRIELWSASLEAIENIPLFGHNVSNRFSAIISYFPDDFPHRFSHPHNDIFAGIISAGLVGGLFTIVSFLSPLFAALLSKNDKDTKLVIGVLLVISIFVTANLNTVLFNDITASWLAFQHS